VVDSIIRPVVNATVQTWSIRFCLVGHGLHGWDEAAEKQDEERALSVQNITVITYKKLVSDAEKSYKDYLDKDQKKGRISQLLKSIEDFK
jgi:hypothetical protein